MIGTKGSKDVRRPKEFERRIDDNSDGDRMGHNDGGDRIEAFFWSSEIMFHGESPSQTDYKMSLMKEKLPSERSFIMRGREE